MKRTIALLAAIVVCAASTAYALYTVSDKGEWPETWPKELEPLRKQARTYSGPDLELLHYAITFTKREELEAAWPHLLKVKSKGAPIILVRRENFFLGDKAKAGVIVHSPPAASLEKRAIPAGPIPGQTNPRLRWMNTSYIELVVDGDIVDLNRLPLPEDTPIIDERFAEKKK